MRRVTIVFTLVLVAGFAVSASAQQGEVRNYGGPISPPLAIPDGPTADPGPVLIPGPPANAVQAVINVPDSGPILDVDVTLGLTHTWYGDLNIYLTHGGVTITLKDGNPDDSSDLGGLYTLDDEAATTWDAAASAAGVSIAPGSYRPNGVQATVPPDPFPDALSTFDGMDKQGDWTISIDDTFLADVGSLSHYSLVITNVPEPTTLGLFVLGGLAAIRRRRR
jgi:subtilisin-like proprotein convertase family protein